MQGLRFQSREFIGVDGAVVEQGLGLGDLVGRARRRAGDGAHVLIGGFLLAAGAASRAFGHALTPGNQIHQGGQERHEDQKQGPQGLTPTIELMIPEDIRQDGEQHHEVGDEREGPEEEPDEIPKTGENIHNELLRYRCAAGS